MDTCILLVVTYITLDDLLPLAHLTHAGCFNYFHPATLQLIQFRDFCCSNSTQQLLYHSYEY